MRLTGFITPIALLVFALPASAQPGLVLDDFDSAINDEIGGDRSLTLDVQANPFSQLAKFDVIPGYAFGEISGAAVFNSGLGVKQTGTIAWDNSGSGLSLDATGFAGLELDFLQTDQDFVLAIDIVSFETGGSASWTGTVPGSATAQTLALAFGEFTLSGEFDLSEVDAVTMRFNAGESPKTSVDFVLTEFRTSVIPSPGPVAVLGLSGLLVRRRRRR